MLLGRTKLLIYWKCSISLNFVYLRQNVCIIMMSIEPSTKTEIRDPRVQVPSWSYTLSIENAKEFFSASGHQAGKLFVWLKRAMWLLSLASSSRMGLTWSYVENVMHLFKKIFYLGRQADKLFARLPTMSNGSSKDCKNSFGLLELRFAVT